MQPPYNGTLTGNVFGAPPVLLPFPYQCRQYLRHNPPPQFHRLCEHGEFKTAADLLHSLMWSRLAPKYFWVTLLVDALPFISCETVAAEGALLNSEQTYELMHCLQEECLGPIPISFPGPP